MGTMRSALSLHFAASHLAAASGQPTAGWLRWFVLGAVALVAVIAFVCLRGYRDNSNKSDHK